ncbi:MAG: S9 family peptidase [Actinobacteria bacterium]|nr:S9 family peptidase [Actinomycetota bacterium]
MQTLPFGTWPSPVTPAMLTTAPAQFADVWVDGDTTVWLEARPAEAGRMQLVRQLADGSRRDLLPEGCNARSSVHEYGGGAVLVHRGTVWFVNFADQRLYVLDGDGAPVALTPEPTEPRSVRWADMRRSPDGEWIVCVRETHHHDHGSEHDVRNELVALRALEPSTPQVLFSDADFVMSPAFVDDARLRWVSWDHPNMPWNHTRLHEATFDAATGALGRSPVVLAEGDAVMQPVGEHVISDHTGWCNVWRIGSDGTATHIAPIDAEVGGPAWVFGERDHLVLHDGTPVFAVGGDVHVGTAVTPTTAAEIRQLNLHPDGRTVTALASYTDRLASIIRFTVDRPDDVEVVASGAAVDIGSGDVSQPEDIAFPTSGGRTAHGWYYPPTNSRCHGPAGAAPPLVVMIHGGPTAAAQTSFRLSTQFWTTRGFAVVDVDYGGSTGYGRDVRDELDGQWGVVDVDDCCASAEWLAAQGLADPAQLVIRGGSAGGFTVLAALALRDVFAAGASLYGVADLTALATDTHKFESRYLDRLVGPWPDARAVYEDRSPIHHLEGFDRPLIVFQDLDDRVVPPNQSEMIVDALRSRGVECEYHSYEGEGHGFRKAATIEHQLSHELAFYQRILGLT